METALLQAGLPFDMAHVQNSLFRCMTCLDVPVVQFCGHNRCYRGRIFHSDFCWRMWGFSVLILVKSEEDSDGYWAISTFLINSEPGKEGGWSHCMKRWIDDLKWESEAKDFLFYALSISLSPISSKTQAMDGERYWSAHLFQIFEFNQSVNRKVDTLSLVLPSIFREFIDVDLFTTAELRLRLPTPPKSISYLILSHPNVFLLYCKVNETSRPSTNQIPITYFDVEIAGNLQPIESRS